MNWLRRARTYSGDKVHLVNIEKTPYYTICGQPLTPLQITWGEGVTRLHGNMCKICGQKVKKP